MNEITSSSFATTIWFVFYWQSRSFLQSLSIKLSKLCLLIAVMSVLEHDYYHESFSGAGDLNFWVVYIFKTNRKLSKENKYYLIFTYVLGVNYVCSILGGGGGGGGGQYIRPFQRLHKVIESWFLRNYRVYCRVYLFDIIEEIISH